MKASLLAFARAAILATPLSENVHFRSEGRAALAARVAAEIEAAVKK
ncbi:MAG: hypothetical protein K8R23_13155 [Chthoniobacter sp.]|nr:hypothetical protein [Chthoniobacter sp.]